jgi:hypothetical protein
MLELWIQMEVLIPAIWIPENFSSRASQKLSGSARVSRPPRALRKPRRAFIARALPWKGGTIQRAIKGQYGAWKNFYSRRGDTDGAFSKTGGGFI